MLNDPSDKNPDPYDFGFQRGQAMPGEVMAALFPQEAEGNPVLPQWVRHAYGLLATAMPGQFDPVICHGRALGIIYAHAQRQLLDRASFSLQEAGVFEQLLNITGDLIMRDTEAYLGCPPGESARFHAGLADGLRAFSEQGEPPGGTSATPIYLHLVLHWRTVETFKSRVELRDWLLESLPKGVVGNLKRIEKLCHRIKLTFKGRGRPRRRNSDT